MYQKIIAVLAEYTDFPLREITPQTDLITDLSLSSIDIINIVAKFEDEFHVTFSEDDILCCSTVGDIQSLIEKHQK